MVEADPLKRNGWWVNIIKIKRWILSLWKTSRVGANLDHLEQILALKLIAGAAVTTVPVGR
jgi:hypothetical protein